MMANLYDPDSRKRETVIRIPRFEIGEHFTVYTIEFGLGPFKWSVNRRFSEFANLHDELYNRHKLRSVDLPAKKIFGNQSYSFVQRRQKELEEYLCRLFQTYTRPPPPLSRFSLWDKYEVHGITATMSAYVLGMGVNPSGTTSNGVPALPLSSSPATPSNPSSVTNQEWRRRLPFEFSVLQIHAINARIDSPAPTNDLDHMKYDVGHIMNFVTHLPAVRVWGSIGQFGTSNIIMNQLKYDLSIFKELETLELVRVDLANMRGVEQLKKTLSKIVVHSTLQTLKEFLLQDLMDYNIGEDSAMVQCWSRVKEADFADNSLRTIDEAIKLLPNVQSLNLSGNQIPSITNLEHLSELQRLNLSRNGITDLINLNAKLGNIKELILVENRLTSLLGLSRVYSLQSLDVSRNQISEIVEVCHIGRLPCLENLRLTDNPVTLIPDYRTKVFEQFGDRSPEVRLDGQRGTEKELDTAAVLQAIQRGKQHRTSSPDIRHGSSVSSVRPRSLHSPASRTPVSVASPNPGSSPDRPNMAAMRSRGGKQWLVEFNHMLDNQERERREEAETASEVQTAVRVPLTQEDEAVGEDASVATITDWSEAAVPTVANDRLEGRLEQALARLLYTSGPPALSAFASALTMMGGEEVGGGGAVAVTQDGRVILLSHHNDSGGTRPRTDSAFDDATRFALLLHWEAPNLAQIVRGFRGQYLRLEERFASGSDGVVVILTLCSSLTDRICDAIAAASGLSVVNLDRVRARQLEDFLKRAEDDPEAELVFYALAMFQSGLLRQLLSVLVSRQRLYLLDEQLASLPAPLCQQQQQQQTSAPSFHSLGVYPQHHLELKPQQDADEAVDVAPEDAFFRFGARVRLSPEARGSLQELGFGFQTSDQRAEFLSSVSNLLPSSAPRSFTREAVPEPVAAGQLAFERWDALSAAVKHRVSSATEASSLQRLLDMEGDQLAAFFARRVRADDGEELVAVLWTYWLHYRSRKQEALACVFLTQRCVHVVFGEDEEETLAFKSLTRRTEDSGRAVRVFCFALSSLRTVYVGPFNHYVRLCGDGRDHDLTLVTRDFRLTENLLSYLRAVFRGEKTHGPVEVGEDEEVYRSSVCPTSVERLAASGDNDAVEIRYPNDEVLSEMMYVVEEAVGNSKGEGGGALSASPHGAMLDSLTLLYYLLLEHLSIDFMEYVTCSSADHLMAVLILTDDYLVVLHQNISQYPIPEYECGPPEVPQFSVLDVRRLKCLTHLTLNSCDRRLLVLSFAPNPIHQTPATPSALPISHSADELGATIPSSPGLVMPESASMSDFSSSVPNTAVPGTIYRPTSNLSPVGDPVHISAFIQNPKDVDKLVKLIKAAWKEYFPGQDLPVHRS